MRLLLPTLFLLALPAVAQDKFPNQIETFPAPQTPTAARAKVTIVTPPLTGCPVGLRAEQRGSRQTLWTIALEDQYRPDQNSPTLRLRRSETGVHVNLNSLGHAMRQVELSVSFLAPGGRVVPLSGQPSSFPRRYKTFTLSAADGSSSKLAGDLFIGATAGILRVHLLSVDYADGTSWHPAAGHTCSVEPNRLLLVGAGY